MGRLVGGGALVGFFLFKRDMLCLREPSAADCMAIGRSYCVHMRRTDRCMVNGMRRVATLWGAWRQSGGNPRFPTRCSMRGRAVVHSVRGNRLA